MGARVYRVQRRSEGCADYGGVIHTPLGGRCGSCERHRPSLWSLTLGSHGASEWSLRADAELNGILAYYSEHKIACLPL